jgi:hypothetical protein
VRRGMGCGGQAREPLCLKALEMTIERANRLAGFQRPCFSRVAKEYDRTNKLVGMLLPPGKLEFELFPSVGCCTMRSSRHRRPYQGSIM